MQRSHRRTGTLILFAALLALTVPAVGGEAGSGCPFSNEAEAPTTPVVPEAGSGCPFSGGEDIADAKSGCPFAGRDRAGAGDANGCPYLGKEDVADAAGGCPFQGRERAGSKDDAPGCPYLAGSDGRTPIDPLRERNKV